jgi:1-acyl-sn-glycerol-3-phosphate acyltransferase
MKHIEAVMPPALGWGLSGWWRRGRAVWRLLRVITHLLHVAVIMPRVFAHADQAKRDALLQNWNADVLRLLGVQRVVHGQLSDQAALFISNHVSWMDIMTINSVRSIRFVSKKEVAHWPIVGTMVTLAGTLYVDRSQRSDAQRVLKDMTHSLQQSRSMVVFPEGTTGHGPQLLHFHANLMQAAIDANATVQPVVIRYADATHAFSPAPVYVGDTSMLESLWWIACAEDLTVHVHVLPARQPPHTDRRTLCGLVQQDIQGILSAQQHSAAAHSPARRLS